MINLSEKYYSIIKDIFQRYLPDVEVRVYGSRINGKSKAYSDLYLVIVGKTKTESKLLIKLKEEFEESDIPFRIDIIDWHRTSKEFRQIINKQYEVI